MKGDFSRLTFDPTKQFTQVFMQQGRVQLDADWNEQAAILLHYLERLAADLIGPFGGPADDLGFKIALAKDAQGKPTDVLTIGKGRYYVDGLHVENRDDKASYTLSQTDKPPLLVYLDVWERHVTYIEDGSIREVALEGPDTATRAQVVWQVKVTNKMPNGETIPSDVKVLDFWPDWVKVWQPDDRGLLKAQAKPGGDPTDPCAASPDARFRGLENQLYRVEIHTRGTAAANDKERATFKWSRDNGSVTFPIVDIKTDKKADSDKGTTTVTLDHLGHEGRSALADGDWVEVVDDTVFLANGVGELLQVKDVDADRRQVILTGTPKNPQLGQGAHPLLRRWDYRRSKDATPDPDDGALLFQEGPDAWIELEDGVQVAFQPAAAGKVHLYRPGDYWLIPARTAIRNIEWLQEQDPKSPSNLVPKALPPFGVRHRFAPLSLVTTDSSGKLNPTDLWKTLKRLTD